MIKKVLGIVLIIILIILIFNYKLVVYGIEQAAGQLKIVYNARPVAEVLDDKTISDSLKQKLILIQEIKRYAEDSLGVTKSQNYTTFYDQKGRPAIWVVTASEAFNLKAYEWHFPFIGSFSYKGFFNKARAREEEQKLLTEGYDTDLGTATGWSTLGWFKDPILSGMLRRKEGTIANIIIHELTHGTLYIKDSVEYNENLANFVGDKGAIQFLNFKHGPQSKQLKEYEGSKKDRDRFTNHMLRGAGKLDSLYKSFTQNMVKNTKTKMKRTLIKQVIKSLDTINFYNKNYYGSSSLYADSINNTFFIENQRYNGKQNNFEEAFTKQFNGNLRNYLKFLKTKYPSL